MHIYCDTDDVFDANDFFIMIHASTSGRKIIKLKEKTDVIEIFQQKILGKNLKEIRLDLRKGRTAVFFTGSSVILEQNGLLR